MGSSLGIPQGDVHRNLTNHKQHIFSHRIKWAVRLKSFPLNIGPDSDLVGPTSSFFNNIGIESSWMGAIWRPCRIRRGGLSCWVPGFVLVDYFGIQPSPKYIAKPTGTEFVFLRNNPSIKIAADCLSKKRSLLKCNVCAISSRRLYCFYLERALYHQAVLIIHQIKRWGRPGWVGQRLG